MNIKRPVLLAAALAVALPATLLTLKSSHAQTIQRDDIAAFEVVYDVGNNLITAGKAILSLTAEDDKWVYSLRTRPSGIFKLTGKGKISEVSTFSLIDIDDGVQLQPITYSYRQDNETRRSVDAVFDWDASSLTFQKRGEETTEEFSNPVLDRLSVTIAIMNALRNGFDRLELTVFDNGQMKKVEFINEGTEVLNTRLGKIETIRVNNRKAGGSSRSTTTWFAPSLDYIPVKIEQMKRDELVARLSLKKLSNRLAEMEIPDTEDDQVDQVDQVEDNNK